MIVDVGDWLKRLWPSETKRRALIADYQSLGQLKHFLADLALRGNAWGACHVPGDPYTSAVNEGRRQLALEILKLAGETPERLYRFLERPTASPPTKRS